VHVVPVGPIHVTQGSPWFVVVLDTTAMGSAGQIARALQAGGWEPSGAFEQRGMISPGNRYGAQGMQWVLPVTRSGPTFDITNLPLTLGTGLYLIDGNPHAPPAPI
jgi:hypothetical protein